MIDLTLSAASTLDAPSLEACRASIARLPITMRPNLNQQLAGWANLFPFERRRFLVFLAGVEHLEPAAFDTLTAPLSALEQKMGVARWPFNQSADTMENASLLARSADYIEWRNQVQHVFSAIESAAPKAQTAAGNSVLLLVLPASLPVAALESWKSWDRRGRILAVEGDASRIAGLALSGEQALPVVLGSADSAEGWLIDAAAGLGSPSGPAQPPLSRLEYTVLRPFRDQVLEQVNRIPKNIQASDDLLNSVRRNDWELWWPAAMTGAACPDPARLRAFLLDLFLSGNGALIFPNAFVQWAAAEALRRARPRLLAARFGMRSRPKPFTGIAIFENQQKINALPEVDDPEGSAVDALILGRYIWLAAARYPEYEHALCLCVAESRNQVYLIPPVGASILDQAKATPEQIAGTLRAHLAG